MIVPMLTGSTLDTDKLPDAYAQMVEVIEKSGVRQFAMDTKGAAFVWGKLPNGGKAHVSVHLPNKESLDKLLSAVNEMLQRMTEGQFKLQVVRADD